MKLVPKLYGIDPKPNEIDIKSYVNRPPFDPLWTSQKLQQNNWCLCSPSKKKLPNGITVADEIFARNDRFLVSKLYGIVCKSYVNRPLFDPPKNAQK